MDTEKEARRAQQECDWRTEMEALKGRPIEEYLDQPCAVLRPSVRLANRLANANIHTVREWITSPPQALSRHWGFSRRVVREARVRLDAIGLSMQDDDGTYNTQNSWPLNATTIRLFAYGTLMFPEIWQQVVGREVPSREATLAGYLAFHVAGQNFPGLVPADESEVVEGLLYEGISETELQALDVYESSMYERVIVKVDDCEVHGGVSTWVYLVKEERRGELTDERWEPTRSPKD